MSTCPSIYPPSATGPYSDERGWSGPLRCVLSAGHEGDRHWNSGINWPDVYTPLADVEQVFLALADDLPGEPPVLLAWCPYALSRKVMDALVTLGWQPPERVMWATGCSYKSTPHHHVGGRCEAAPSAASQGHRESPEKKINSTAQTGADRAHWATRCAYCNAETGGVEPCCADCRSDKHAHCPSWPSCTRENYGRDCDATRTKPAAVAPATGAVGTAAEAAPADRVVPPVGAANPSESRS